jgi:hypothetical protein
MRDELRQSLALLPPRSKPWIWISKQGESRVKEFVSGRRAPTGALSIEGPTKYEFCRTIILGSHPAEPSVNECQRIALKKRALRPNHQMVDDKSAGGFFAHRAWAAARACSGLLAFTAPRPFLPIIRCAAEMILAGSICSRYKSSLIFFPQCGHFILLTRCLPAIGE